MRRQGSWLSLLTFCALSVFASSIGAGILLAGASVAFAVAEPTVSEAGSANVAPPRNANGTAVVLPTGAEPAPAPPIDESGNATSNIFSGVVTDSKCGARHRRNSGKTSAECAEACVRNGANYVLVDGEKVYALAGDLTQLKKKAGERVNVMGVLEGDTITVKDVVSEPPQ